MDATLVRTDTATRDDLASLAASLQGRLILPRDAEYDGARLIHNTAYLARPVAIARVAGAQDVGRAIAWARRTGTPMAVRSGGHSLAGFGSGEGTLVIDMRALRELSIDPERRRAIVGAGLTAGEVTDAAGAHGLAIPFGDTGSVGVAGLTLGGGIGWLARRHGLAIDHLVSATVVTATGEVLTASAEEHADLFWAIRGGGGNFGVVTRFEFDLVPVGTILGGGLVLPATAEAIAGVIEAADAAPDELTMIAMLMPAPPAPGVPEAVVGTMSLVTMIAYAGDPAAGQRALDPLRRVATPLAEMLAPMPYAGIYSFTEGAETPAPAMLRSMFVDRFERSGLDLIVARMTAEDRPDAMVQFRVLGGAVARVSRDATAFAHRERRAMLAIMAGLERDAERTRTWVEDLHAALAPAARGAYVNFLEAEGDERIRQAYPGATYERLVATKRRYDPENVFSRNQNIRPD